MICRPASVSLAVVVLTLLSLSMSTTADERTRTQRPGPQTESRRSNRDAVGQRSVEADTGRAAPSVARRRSLREPDPEALFERLDRNRDKMLSLDEFAAGIRNFSQPGRDSRARDDAKRSVPDDAKVVMYTVDGMDSKRSFYMMRFLTSQFPEAEFTMATEPTHMMVRACPKDHEGIASLLEQMNQKALEESPKAVLYTLEVASASFASEVLQTAVPEAKLTVESGNPRRFVAWARRSEHETITDILGEIDVEPPAEAALQVRVYTAGAMTGSSAISVLAHVVPEAMMSLDSDSNRLIVLARAKDHKSIVAILEAMGGQAAAPKARLSKNEQSQAVATLTK